MSDRFGIFSKDFCIIWCLELFFLSRLGVMELESVVNQSYGAVMNESSGGSSKSGLNISDKIVFGLA